MPGSIDKLTETFKAGLEFAKNAAVAAAMAALPLLRVPIISFFFKMTVNWVVGKIAPFLSTWFRDTVVDIQVNAQRAAYATARKELGLVLKKTIRGPKELANVSQEFDRRFDELVNLNL